MDGSPEGHLGQRPKQEALGVGPAVRSVSGLVGANLLLQLKWELMEEMDFKLRKNPGPSLI